MIHQGDRFTYLDLQQSMREICEYDMRKYMGRGHLNIGVAVGDSFIVPGRCTPDEYAATCMRAYGNIQSSATNLDKQLRDMGFKTTYRFSYKYNNGGLAPEQIIHDAYCLDWFQSLARTATPHAKYKAQYFAVLQDAFSLSYYYAQYLWAQNRGVCDNIAKQLSRPDMPQWSQIIGALLGIGFRFHPADVYEYAIEHTSPNITKRQFDARYARQSAFKQEMQDNYGIDTGCLVLSPQNQEKLRKIVTRTDTPYYIQVLRNLVSGHNR